jgi:hypothetical protein
LELQRELQEMERARVLNIAAVARAEEEASGEIEGFFEGEAPEFLEDPESDLFMTGMSGTRERPAEEEVEEEAGKSRVTAGLGHLLQFSPIKEERRIEFDEDEEPVAELGGGRRRTGHQPVQLLSHSMKKTTAGGSVHPHTKPGRTFMALVEDASAVYSHGSPSKPGSLGGSSLGGDGGWGGVNRRDMSRASMRSAASSSAYNSSDAGGGGGRSGGGGSTTVPYLGSPQHKMHLAAITEFPHVKPFLNKKNRPVFVNKVKSDAAARGKFY